MTGKRWSFATAGVLACVVAACAEDEGLAPEEADAIVNLVGGTASGALLAETLSSSTARGDFDYDLTVPCPDGGSVTMSGTGELRVTAGGGEYELEGTNEFADCSHEEDGVALTLVSGVVAQRFLMGVYIRSLTRGCAVVTIKVRKRRHLGGVETMANGPGKSYRKGISLMELAARFPNEEAAQAWFEGIMWPNGEMACLKCGSTNAYRVKSGKPMPYRCRDCRSYFSLKTSTALAGSNLTLRQWAYGIYLVVTNLKSVSSMKLHRDLGVTQKTAWFMLHRIRETWGGGDGAAFAGPVEVDETYVGGLERNKHESKKLKAGRGPVGKAAIVGAKDRETGQVAARVIETVDGETLNGFVDAHATEDAKVYTDGSTVYKGRKNHESVAHSAGEYVRYLEGETIHTNGVESFWSMLKRAHKGTFHRLSAKHLQRYVSEFAGRHNIRDLDTIRQMENVAAGLVGRRLLYRDLVADNGLSGAAT